MPHCYTYALVLRHAPHRSGRSSSLYARFLHVLVATQVYKRTAQNAGASEQEHERAQRASQSLLSRVSRGGLLTVVPDPVTCFKDSSFRQVGRPPPRRRVITAVSTVSWERAHCRSLVALQLNRIPSRLFLTSRNNTAVRHK